MLIGTTTKLNMTSALTTLTNTAHTITATGLNTISSSLAGVANDISASGANSYNRIQNSGSSGQNLIIATLGTNRIASNSGLSYANQLDAYGTGGNEIKTTTGDNTITSTSGTNRIQINGTDKITVNSTDTALTNTTNTINGTTNVNGYLTNTSAGGGGFTMVGSGTSGLYTNYYPDGIVAGRKAYMGFPNTADTSFVLSNSYTTGSIANYINGAVKLVQTTTTTTITNTDVGVVGNLNATRYNIGTTALNKPLSSMIMGVGYCQVVFPASMAALTNVTTTGTWIGGTTFFRTPDYGVFVPTFFTITYSGGFAGGTGATHFASILNNSTSTVIASSNSVAYTSAMTTSASGGDTTFTTTGNFSAGNLFTVRITLTTGISTISSSTKIAYLQVYGYQLNP
jgi:hypothetical protein